MQLIVDHSLAVECGGFDPQAFEKNRAIEDRRNEDRFHFIEWTRKAFQNVDVIPPGNGIMHQINLEKMSPVIQVLDGVAFPDSCVGTDSHTPHVDALGVLAIGVGGLEAENVMLGRASWMRLPDIVAVELTGRPGSGILATDVVLALTEFLRKQKVVGAYLEFRGEGVASLSLGDRATIANMAPEYGATAAMFFIDQQTIDYLKLTGRDDAQVKLVETYARHTGLWADCLACARYERSLVFDLSSVVRNIAGPSNPHARVATSELAASGIAGPWKQEEGLMPDGAVIIAAITSCTNTSNPRNLIAAGLLARNANRYGLQRKPWVKSSLAPGSRVSADYLNACGLMQELEQLGFGVVGFACTTCNGMSGALDASIQQEIVNRDLYTTAVLSGNRNFDGRIHPYAKQAFLASPPLVIAYAIAGTVRFDIEKDAFAIVEGRPVRLKDLWPSDEEIDAVMRSAVKPEQFRKVYREMFRVERDAAGQVPPLYAWRPQSTYIRRPPYWEGALAGERKLQNLRPLALLGDNITTDHLSPSNAILPDSAAGEYLKTMGLAEEDFNSYATHRGDHLTALRATFANPTLVNEMAIVDGKLQKGSLARLEPDAKVMRMWEAIEIYMDRRQPLIIIAGADYGQGSSRDWAAKGVRLAGVEAIVAEGFERIHRTNLIGMGVLPLEFEAGTNRKTLGIDGSETFDVLGRPQPGERLRLIIRRPDGQCGEVSVICRLDTAEELSIYQAGGVLQRFAQDFLETERPKHQFIAKKPAQIKIAATYLRGGTSKGVFFKLEDLPVAAQRPGSLRDRLLMRVIGSPDPYGKQIDGMGAASSSTSKVVILSPGSRPDHDVDYLFGQVSIDAALIDWSGNCGNLSAAVGPFAIANGLVDPSRVPSDGVAIVRIWQANIGKTIIARVPITKGQVQETGDFELDGVSFPSAEIQLEFIDPGADEEGADAEPAMFPTGHLVDALDVPGLGTLQATLINAGIPTIFINAKAIGLAGTELQDAVNNNPELLARFEQIRAHGALRMGLIQNLSQAQVRQHSPKVAFVAPPCDYVASSGTTVSAQDIDLVVRALSMGKLHHAMMGTAAVAIATAAAIPGTLVNQAAGGGPLQSIRFGHPSGSLRVGAEAIEQDGQWLVKKVLMSRSARILMEGFVRVPAEALDHEP
ncbi:MAG: Fe/S-dependent 2-methylisocitrate dehydratase AcnD [Betaproteobacteria bacterium]|nr:Fe/S-dependent 2-methylisocitrate dehydratase AcnD [Betaproteobacteria bacterium]